ncbi:MAG: AI-2E family transporter [Geitlerinemataceae cyanobacterium]
MKFSQGLFLFCLAISIYFLWQLRQVLLLIFTALIFATVLNRLVRRFCRAGVKPRWLAVVFVVLMLPLILGIFSIAIVPSFSAEWQELLDRIPLGFQELRERYAFLNIPRIDKLLSEIGSFKEIFNQLPSYGDGLFSSFIAIFSNSLDFVVNLLLVIVLTIMFLATPNSYRKAFIQIIPASSRPQIHNILNKCEKSLLSWIFGILFNMSIILILSWVGLLFLKVQFPFINAIIAGLLTFIPNIGPVLSVIPPVALALIDAPWKASFVIGLYVLIQQVESNILTPIVMKERLSLLPAATLLSQVIFGVFFGFLGLFLALPIVVILQVIIQETWVKKAAEL